MITLQILKVTFKTNCKTDPECEAMAEWLESRMADAATVVASRTAAHFGYEVTSVVEN